MTFKFVLFIVIPSMECYFILTNGNICVNRQYAEVKFIPFYSCGPNGNHQRSYAWSMMNIFPANFLLFVTDCMTVCTHYSLQFHSVCVCIYIYALF